MSLTSNVFNSCHGCSLFRVTDFGRTIWVINKVDGQLTFCIFLLNPIHFLVLDKSTISITFDFHCHHTTVTTITFLSFPSSTNIATNTSLLLPSFTATV